MQEVVKCRKCNKEIKDYQDGELEICFDCLKENMGNLWNKVKEGEVES